VLFIYINIDEEDNVRILEFFGLKASECPTYRYINLGDDIVKYKPDAGDMTADSVSSFVSSILDGKRQVSNCIYQSLITADKNLFLPDTKEYRYDGTFCVTVSGFP